MRLLYLLKRRSVLTASLFMCLFLGSALSNVLPAQNDWWFMPPYMVNTDVGTAAPSTLKILPAGTIFLGNFNADPIGDGFYNGTNGSGFYVRNDLLFNVFDPISFGNLPHLPGTYGVIENELQIIKVPGLCETFYVVYKEHGFDVVRYVIVEKNASTNKYQWAGSGVLPVIQSNGNVGMATSKVNPVTGKRNLYLSVYYQNIGVKNGVLYTFEVDENGIVFKSNNIMSGVYSPGGELELNESGDKLGWTVNNLGGTGSWCFVLDGIFPDGSIPGGNITASSTNVTTFTANSSNGNTTGIEFIGNKVAFSAGVPSGSASTDGIYLGDLSSGALNFVSGSTPYAWSQLEKGRDGFVYAATKVANGNFTLRAVNVGTTAMHATKLKANMEHFPLDPYTNNELYFPDQIDGEDYPLSNGIRANAGPNKYICSGACVTMGVPVCEDNTDNNTTWSWAKSVNGGSTWISLTPAGSYNTPVITVPVSSTSLYRVTATESYLGGTLSHSDIVSVWVSPWCYAYCGIGGGGGNGGENSNKTGAIGTGFSFKTFPNPIEKGGSVHLELNNPFASELSISLMDLQGRTLQTLTQQVTEGMSVLELSTEQFSAGLYSLKIVRDGEVYHEKLIIQ